MRFSSYLLFTLLTGFSSHTQCEEINMHTYMSQFDSMIGSGKLKRTAPIEEPTVTDATLTKTDNTVTFAALNFTHVLALKTESKTIVSIASESGHLLICPGGIEKCHNEHLLPTEQEGENKLVMKSSFSKRRYVVERSEETFIYRIQEKNCLLKYPHGCLIYGFGWHDQYTYEFTHSN